MINRPNRTSLYRVIFAFLAISAICVGCGKSKPKTVTQVKGYVTFRGQPLRGGTIVFAPDRDRGGTGKTLIATIGDDGGYVLTGPPDSGIPPGWYRVAISEPASSEYDSSLGWGFPAALRRPDLSGLEREVKIGQDNVFDFLIELME
jgi:hypothetical protein